MDIKTILNRTKNLIANPDSEFEVIKNEQTTNGQLLGSCVLPYVIAIAIAEFLGKIIFGYGSSFSGMIFKIIISFGLNVASIYIFAFIMQLLAPTFGGDKNNPNYFKLSAYILIPGFLANIVSGLIPALSFVELFGLYGLYLFWIGAVKLAGIPENGRVGFVLLSILIMVAVYALLGFILFSLLFASFLGAGMAAVM